MIDESMIKFDHILLLISIVLEIIIIAFFAYLISVLPKISDAVASYNTVMNSTICEQKDIDNAYSKFDSISGLFLFSGFTKPLVNSAIANIHKKCDGNTASTLKPLSFTLN